MQNLTTREARLKAKIEIENSFVDAVHIKGNGIERQNIKCRISEMGATLYLVDAKGKNLFGAEIDLQYDYQDIFGQKNKAMKINFGTSGAFGLDNQAAWWRTIQSAHILNFFNYVQQNLIMHIERYVNLQSVCKNTELRNENKSK